jgi:hypothetical protein
MRIIKIFVEGDSDKKFVSDYIGYLKIVLYDIDLRFILLNGKDDDKFQKTLPEFAASDKNLVIVDSDENFAGRKKHLEELKGKLSLSYDVFLFPNNSDNGELETLLKGIVWNKYKEYFSCFIPFGGCVQGVHSDIKPPSLKDEIYSYLSSLLTDKETDQRGKYIQPSKMDYMNERFWDIEHSLLKPLKEFLLSNIR